MGVFSFSVLGLGSSAYPHFGSFGTYLDKSLFQLGGKRVVSLMICDELSQPEKTFKR